MLGSRNCARTGRLPGTLLTLLLLAAPAVAQRAPIDCRDLQNRPVRIRTDQRIAYAAYATLDRDGVPLIYWNPRAANGRSTTWTRFVLLHECGHVLLHHLNRSSGTLEDRRRAEVEADCYAIRVLADSRRVSGTEFQRLFAELAATIGDPTHLGGEELLERLEQCLHNRSDTRSWHEALDRLLLASGDSFASITGTWLGHTWAGEIHEATLDLPGTFDCEIRPPGSFVCLMLAADGEKPAHRRFQELRRVVEGWLTSDWTRTDRAERLASHAELFLAQSASDGTFLALVRTTASRVYFVARPTSR